MGKRGVTERESAASGRLNNYANWASARNEIRGVRACRDNDRRNENARRQGASVFYIGWEDARNEKRGVRA